MTDNNPATEEKAYNDALNVTGKARHLLYASGESKVACAMNVGLNVRLKSRRANRWL